jgi:hypothetical protein
MEPSARRAARHRSRLPGRQIAQLDTVARSAHRDYADIWWQWSLRDDGSAWYRMARVWYWRPVPHTPRRREPPLWRQVAHLEPPGTVGQAAAAELLARVARGHGHYPAGPELPARPTRERQPAAGGPRLPEPAAALPPLPQRGPVAGIARALRMIFLGVTDADVEEHWARERLKEQRGRRR